MGNQTVDKEIEGSSGDLGMDENMTVLFPGGDAEGGGSESSPEGGEEAMIDAVAVI